MLRKLLIGNRNNIVKDKNGRAIYYKASNFSLDGTNNINTNFIPFDGKDFSLRLKAKFSYADNSSSKTYPTLLNALEEVSPYNGFLIRYEGSVLYFVHKSAHYNLSLDSNDYLDISVTLKDKVLTVINHSTQVATINVDYTLNDLTIYLGCSVDADGNPQRDSVSYISFFEVKKI